jgi:beta-lactam-binding protein with PASTA domain
VLFSLAMRTVLLVAVIFLFAGCGEAVKQKRVPDVRGQRLDLAEDRLDAHGLGWEEIGGGTLGIVIRSHWWVCDQEPAPGRLERTVKLVVERECPNVPPQPPLVPDVVGLSLEDATDELDDLGIAYDAKSYDEDVPLVEHLWEVCDQEPVPGARDSFVELYVARDCD